MAEFKGPNTGILQMLNALKPINWGKKEDPINEEKTPFTMKGWSGWNKCKVCGKSKKKCKC